MKLITCPHCKADRIGPVTDEQPAGGAVLMSQYVGGSQHPIVFKCFRCTNAFKLTAVGFNGLPTMTTAQVAKFAPSLQSAVD